MTAAGVDEVRWRVTEAAPARGWTFLTNHAHVLLVLTSSPGMRLRDVADAVGITERAAQRIVAELEAAGYLTRIRVGRRNEYRVHPDLPLRHPLEAAHPVRRLLEVLAPVSPFGARDEPTAPGDRAREKPPAGQPGHDASIPSDERARSPSPVDAGNGSGKDRATRAGVEEAVT